MTSKGFCVKIYFDLNIISCPGVWLCPNGNVALQINCLNSHIESTKLPPTFPLNFNNKFLFKNTFTDVGTLSQLQYALEDEYLYAELIQWTSENRKGVVLATFEINLADLLYPAPCYKGLISGIDIDLLMEPSKYFPGIIAPKIEISTHTIIEETELCHCGISGTKIVNKKLINSKGRPCIHRKRPQDGIIRQKRVCHTQSTKKLPAHRCGCGHNVHMSAIETIVPCPIYSNKQAHTNQCYQKPRKDLMYSQSCVRSMNHYKNSSQLVFHDFDDCPVCLKYKHYFNNKAMRSNNTFTIRSDGDTRRQLYCDCPEHKSSGTKSTTTLHDRVRHLERSN